MHIYPSPARENARPKKPHRRLRERARNPDLHGGKEAHITMSHTLPRAKITTSTHATPYAKQKARLSFTPYAKKTNTHMSHLVPKKQAPRPHLTPKKLAHMSPHSIISRILPGSGRMSRVGYGQGDPLRSVRCENLLTRPDPNRTDPNRPVIFQTPPDPTRLAPRLSMKTS